MLSWLYLRREEGFSLVRLQQPPLLAALNDALRVQDPASLSRGRDVREPGDYTSLQLAAAWRVENPFLWDKYMVERAGLAAYSARVAARGDEVP